MLSLNVINSCAPVVLLFFEHPAKVITVVMANSKVKKSLIVSPWWNTYTFGNSISSSIFTKPYFSYKGLPISVASRDMAVMPLRLASVTSKSRVL